MSHPRRTVEIPILAQEICIEARALAGISGRHVLLQILANRLGVSWEQLMEAVVLADRMGWIEASPGSVVLLKGGHQLTFAWQSPWSAPSPRPSP